MAQLRSALWHVPFAIVAKSGGRFMITDCTIWNLLDAEGIYNGRAAVFVRQD